MKICKLKPDKNKCYGCLDYQIDHNLWLNCNLCDLMDNKDYELIKEKCSFLFFKYSLVMIDGKKIRVDRERIYDIREVD